MLKISQQPETDQRIKAVKGWLRHPEAQLFKEQVRHAIAIAQAKILDLDLEEYQPAVSTEQAELRAKIIIYRDMLDVMDSMLDERWAWQRVTPFIDMDIINQ